MAQTYKTYYENESLWGGYQYMTLHEIIQRIERETTDQDSYMANVRRSKIVDVAKDGLRVLSRIIKKTLLAVEITVPPSQFFPLPQDFVDWKRVSLVSDNFRLQTLYQNNNIPTARGYLQDSNYDLLFSDPEEDVLEADASNMFNKPYEREITKPTDQLIAGEFKIYEERGVIAFSPEVVDKEVVIEYVSDGLQELNLKDATVRVHKMVYEPLIAYIYSECIFTRRNIRIADKQLFRNRYLKLKHDALIAAMDLDMNQLLTAEPSNTIKK